MTRIRARLIARLRLAPHTRADGRERRWLALPRLVAEAHREALRGLGGAGWRAADPVARGLRRLGWGPRYWGSWMYSDEVPRSRRPGTRQRRERKARKRAGR